MQSGREYFRELDSGMSAPISSANVQGGTIVNVIFALIFFGLLIGGVLWLLKGFADAGKQYGDTMIETTNSAEVVKCQTNLRTIGQNIKMYAISNDEFPPSQRALMEWCNNIRLFRCPANEGDSYIYIPGQNAEMPPGNILVYESKPRHQGRCNVLRLGGQIELLTPEELRQAVSQTLAQLK
jgi:hypothetical protein